MKLVEDKETKIVPLNRVKKNTPISWFSIYLRDFRDIKMNSFLGISGEKKTKLLKSLKFNKI